MALLVLIYLYLKFFFTMPRLAFNKHTPAYCIRGVLHFLFMATIWAFNLYFFNALSPPAMLINACLNPSNTLSISSGFNVLALRCRHSLRIRRCSFVKFFRIFLSVSALMDTIRPRAVSGAIPTRRSLNSSHFTVESSRDKRIPYCD